MALVYLTTMRGAFRKWFYGTELQMSSPQNVMMAKSEATSPVAGREIVAMDLAGAAPAKQNVSHKISSVAYSLGAKPQPRYIKARIHFIPENNCYVHFRVLNTAERRAKSGDFKS